MTAQHIEIARAVRATLGPENLLFHNHAFWRWRDRGVWVRIEDRELQREIHALLDTGGFQAKFGRATVDSILDLLRTECFRAEHRWNLRAEVINTSSGLVTWNDDLQNWTVEAHRREDFITVQIPVTHDANARCPRFLQFLKEVFVGNADAADKALVIMEMIGYSLLTTCRYERFILLIGGGANGKTVLLKVVEALVGVDMVCAVQPSQLDNKFQRAHLAGKLVNIVTEIAEGAKIGSSTLYQDYREWAQEQGVSRTLAQKSFIQRLSNRYGLESVRDMNQRYVAGLQFRANTFAEHKIVEFRGAK